MKSALRASRVSSVSSTVTRDANQPDILVSIDPGITGSGWAIWRQPERPLAAGVIGAVRKSNRNQWWHRADTMAYHLQLAWDDTLVTTGHIEDLDHPVHVWIEFPMLMESIKGVAAQRGGSTLKLAYLIGAICARVPPLWSTQLVTPLQWKGQLPKSVVTYRIQRQLGARVCQTLGLRSHAWDAVGIGLHGWERTGK